MAVITFGASISLSGKYALQGRQALAGMLAWAEATNEAGGIVLRRDKTRVRLHYYDDNSEAAQAARNTQHLIRGDKVRVLLGSYSSELMLAAASVAAEQGRVIWNHGGASEAIHERGARAVGVLTPASRYFREFPALALRLHPGSKSIVCCHRAGSGFGRRVAQGALVAAQQLRMNATIRIYGSIEDIPELVKGLGVVDCILGAGSFEEDVCLGRELLKRGLPRLGCGLVAAGLAEFYRALGRDSEGFLAPSQWEPSLRLQPDFGPQTGEVLARIDAHRLAADYLAAQAYAACLIAQRCLEQAGSWDDDTLWRTAGQLDCTTFFGRFRIDPDTGLQVGHQMVWVQWQQGNKAIVWPPHYAQAEPLPLRQVGQEVD